MVTYKGVDIGFDGLGQHVFGKGGFAELGRKKGPDDQGLAALAAVGSEVHLIGPGLVAHAPGSRLQFIQHPGLHCVVGDKIALFPVLIYLFFGWHARIPLWLA